MPDDRCAEGASLFRALSHPTRPCIVNLLRRGDVCVSHLQFVLERPQSNISQHLALLHEAGIVECYQVGK